MLLILILAGCSNPRFRLLQQNKHTTTNTNYYTAKSYYKTPEYKRATVDYRILKHDRLSVVIYQHPNLIPPTLQQRGILVDSSGYVSLPLVGRVHVAGLTQSEAAKLLERKYARYLKKPGLNVEVLNKRVYILGEVRKPGPIPLDKEQITILEALSYAGGLSDDAVRDDVIVLSSNRYGGMQIRHLDLTNFSKLASSNMILKPNDIVYVQPNSAKIYNVETKRTILPFDILSRIIAPFATIKTLSQ
jgi:polysaccharide export outer membrane protein